MRFAVLLITAFILNACAQREGLLYYPEAARINPVQTIFIATTRAPNRTGGYGNGRQYEPNFARYDIALPPGRKPGQIDYSKRKIDTTTQFLTTASARYPSRTAFRSGVAKALRDRPAKNREVAIYVHGFNNTFAEGIMRIAQLTQDNEFEGIAMHYSWASAENPLNYAYDRESVLFARDGLEAMINEVRAAGAKRIVLVGHSIGSELIMETLRQIAIARPGSVAHDFAGVILFSPDIDIDVFRSQVARIGTLPKPFGIFISKRDRALKLSARLTGQSNRLGNVQDLGQIADLEITVVDVTGFSSGIGHFTAADSPDVIRLMGKSGDLQAAFEGDSAGRAGLLPGTILTVQNATAIILSPVVELLTCGNPNTQPCFPSGTSDILERPPAPPGDNRLSPQRAGLTVERPRPPL